MSVTKHKIFKVKISEDSNLSLSSDTRKTIDAFLANPNHIYVNHSTSILSEDIEVYGQNKTVNKFLVISLVYKDLNDTGFDVSKTSPKVRQVVSKEIEVGREIEKPNVETEFEKSIKPIMFIVNNKPDSKS
jgi:putative transposon-encoded protein